MAEKKNVPQVRFSNFTEEWVPTKIENTFVDYIEKTVVQNQYPVLTSSQQKGIVLQQEYFADRQVTTNDNIGYFVLPRGYFTFRSRSDNDVFVFNRNDIVDKGIISYFYPVFNVTGADSNFFLRRVNHGIKRQLAIAAEGTGQHVLSLKKFKEIITLFPKEKEQQKIGKLFEHMDALISDTQSKLEKLQALRSSMLEKMFPKDDSDTPEIRFKGFAGAWRHYQLNDIVQPYSDPVRTPDDGYFRLGIRSHGKGTFHNYVAPGMELETAQMHRVAANNLIVNITFAWEHAVAITGEADSGKLVSHRFPQFTFNDGMLPRFFKYAILDDKFRHHLWLSSPGGAGRNRVLKIDEMLKYKFWVPETVEEQERIADYLDRLTEMVNFAQQEITKLQNLKKALLEKMFV